MNFSLDVSVPVVMDTTGEIFVKYGISSVPTTFMIDKDGKREVECAFAHSIFACRKRIVLIK